jgi:hypothetical protein
MGQAGLITPNFFIVGAPKCGTTALYTYLKAHPEVFMPVRKEPHFFGRDLDHLPIDAQTLDEYLGLFADSHGEPRIGEASVWYLVSKTAAREIKDFAPGAQIIVVLRNPVDMVYSLYQQNIYVGAETLSFAAALDAEPERRAGQRIPRTVRRRQALWYREVASYTEQVARYFDTFGREVVHIVIFDDFKADTRGSYRSTLEFLSVDPCFETEFAVVNRSKLVRNRTFHYGYTRLEQLGMRHLPHRWWPYYRRFFISILRTINTYKAPRPPLDPDLRMRLQADFRPEVEQLSALLGRDLTAWCEPEEHGV